MDNKIKLAENIIHSYYKKHNGKLFINFSGGKDSTVLLHIALSLYPGIKVVFANTTNERKEILQYVKKIKQVITVYPKLTFAEVIVKHGFPLVSKEVAQKVYELKHTKSAKLRNTRLNGDVKGNGKLSKKWQFLANEQFNTTHKCCKILKKDPLDKWAKSNGMIPVIALMGDESRLRSQLSLQEDNPNKVYPFLKTGWNEADIWEYAKQFNIRFAECYYDSYKDGKLVKGLTRTGCEFCAFGITMEKNNRFERSQILTPKKYKKFMNLENNGVTFEDAIKVVKRDMK